MVPVAFPMLDALHTVMPRGTALPMTRSLCQAAQESPTRLRFAPNQRRRRMNWDQVAGNWKQFKGKVKEKWGDLNDDDLTYIDGKRDQLIGRVQERYGIAKDEAERQVKAWERMS
jgi:uncharacterized protein YjbJ (UPF0337 family)